MNEERKALIIALLRLWQAFYNERPHPVDCDCPMCGWHETAGELDARVFDELAQDCGISMDDFPPEDD